MPDIRNFDIYKNTGRPFARFDYMHVKPTLTFCQGFMKVCDDARAIGIKLQKQHLQDEERAFLIIKNKEYVTTEYWWLRRNR